MSPEVWAVIADTMETYKGVQVTDDHRKTVEAVCKVEEFPGGAFVIHGAEIDCFVIPEKRGCWASRSLLRRVVGGLVKQHGRAVCRIDRRNVKSLNFAKRLGFREVSASGDVVKLELKTWKL